ncbi:hypothetical protein DLR74_13745 [Vibrio paracholerae]|nr:hypothetical protein DLR74_13745 [Vibrio paracholerae]
MALDVCLRDSFS